MLTRFLLAAALAADWSGYLGGPESAQYSPLDQITIDNADKLEVAWTYHCGDAREGRTQMQCNPLVIDGTLYGSTPGLKVIALDAATGKLKWTYDPFDGKGAGINRGLAYWADGDDRRIFYGAGARILALDADTGQRVEDFGDRGSIDLRLNLSPDASKAYMNVTSPPLVFEDLLIAGMRVAENLPAAPGHIRAYSTRTGELVWTFHTIPQPGEFGAESWPKGAHEYAGGANNWSGMSVDTERGIVYIPTGAAAYDFFGENRHGNNLFANTLLALNARTGERVWHYQVIHHDLWDRDLPAPPNLVTINKRGRVIDAVAQITKHGYVYVFDRVTGAPVFPMEEIEAPASPLPGERTSPTQPLPLLPPPFARQTMELEDITRRTPEAHQFVLEHWLRIDKGHPFQPPARNGTLVFPGFDGGGEWGGAAVDPDTGILYVNHTELPRILTMVPGNLPGGRGGGRWVYALHCIFCHGPGGEGIPQQDIPSLAGIQERLAREEAEQVVRMGRARMPGFPHLRDRDVEKVLDFIYDDKTPIGSEEAIESMTPMESDDPLAMRFVSTGYNKFLDPDGFPAITPPWGQLTAIDLNVGQILWQIPLGDFPGAYPGWEGPTGTEQYGGPVVTKGGVLFIAATKDEMFHAIDMRDGTTLYQHKLPAAGYATPAVYAIDGQQYIVVACGGGKIGSPAGDAYVAFKLPTPAL